MSEKFRKTFLGLSALYILAGLVMIIWPDAAKKAICIALGCVLVLLGLIRIVRCWKGDSLGQLDGGAAFGVLLLIAGVLLLTQHEVVTAMLSGLIGLCLVVDGFVKLQLACSLKRLGLAAWKRDMIAAIVLMAMGAFLLFDPFPAARAMVIVTGVVLLLNGLVDLWAIWEAGQTAKRVAQGLPASDKK